ncbi:MAG: MCE family protein [Frankiales bacterium]|nr:MCE family protein [Frankiales bacterium]
MSGVSTFGSAWRFAIFAVVTVLATALLAVTIVNIDTEPAKGYSAIFTDAANVTPGDEVRYAGVRVGTVTGVSLAPGNHAKVNFTVATTVPLTTTSRIDVRYRNLIGQRYIAVVDGPPGGTSLKAGTTVPLARTKPALNLTTLFNGFHPLLSGLSPGDVNQLSYELVQALHGEGGTVDSLFRQVGTLTNSLANRDALIGRVIDNLDATLGPVADHDRQLSALIGNVQQFVSGLSQDRGAISRSLVSIDKLTGATASLLHDGRPALAADIRHLGTLAEKLNVPASRALIQHFLTYTPFKLKVATPEASYGAFLNFYVCAVNFILPDGTETPFQVNSAKRCHVSPTGVPK